MTMIFLCVLAVAFTFGALYVAIGPSWPGAPARRGGPAPGVPAAGVPAAGARFQGAAASRATAPAGTGPAIPAAQGPATRVPAGPPTVTETADVPGGESAEASPIAPQDALVRLYGLALGVPDLRLEPHAEARDAIAHAVALHAADPRYAPRRPMLLPQLMQAMNDERTSRRQLEQIITQDPALVGSLLKLANSPVYRHGSQPIESVNRAVAQLGTEGIRSLVAAALVQPVFRARAAAFASFPEIAWEHTFRAAAATEAYAALVESTDRFAAQLLGLLMGLGSIVVFRIVLDHGGKSAGTRPDAALVAAALISHTADAAWRIADDWRLSERPLAALDGERPNRAPEAPGALGRALRFGRVAGALSVLQHHDLIDDDTARLSLPVSALVRPHALRIWERLALADALPDEGR